MENNSLIQFLKQSASEARYDTFIKVLNDRTRYLSIVLEDIYQPQNASAVLRTADCFGVQDVHIIENNHEYRINPDVEKGASSWLSLYRYDKEKSNTREALRKLKKEGYRIVATTPHTDDIDLFNIDVTKGKMALVFGTEVTGISDVVREEADEYLRIPMHGFTESFNISVSAALVMQHLRWKIEQEEIRFLLSEKEKEELMIEWLRKSIKKSDALVRRYEKMKQEKIIK
jgi:tRNA (guanosine-2'-O-)-methyltransferase